MTQELTKKLVCILMRSGVEIWVEEEKIDGIVSLMEKKSIFRVSGQIVNTADISGIFDANTMEENTYRKNGYWKCKQGNYWHKKNEECGHK